MKPNLLVIVLLLCANLALGLLACSGSQQGDGEQTASGDDAITCYYGGPGNESCEIAAGIDIDGGISTSCSVTCEEGFYACCGLECRCYPEK